MSKKPTTKKTKTRKECNHSWEPFGENAVTSYVDNGDCCPARYFEYHWYCTKCKATKYTEDGGRI